MRTMTGDQSPRDAPALPLGTCMTSTLTIFMMFSFMRTVTGGRVYGSKSFRKQALACYFAAFLRML